jgi:hypothetical protein
MTALEEPKPGHVEFGPGRRRGDGSPFERVILAFETVLASVHGRRGEIVPPNAGRSTIEVEEDIVARLYGGRTGTVELRRPNHTD